MSQLTFKENPHFPIGGVYAQKLGPCPYDFQPSILPLVDSYALFTNCNDKGCMPASSRKKFYAGGCATVHSGKVDRGGIARKDQNLVYDLIQHEAGCVRVPRNNPIGTFYTPSSGALEAVTSAPQSRLQPTHPRFY